MNFETIKKNYDRNLWSKAMVKMDVRKGVITKNEYQTITGDEYTGKLSSITTDELDAAYQEGVQEA